MDNAKANAKCTCLAPWLLKTTFMPVSSVNIKGRFEAMNNWNSDQQKAIAMIVFPAMPVAVLAPDSTSATIKSTSTSGVLLLVCAIVAPLDKTIESANDY
jgi:hypothetical protein